MVKYKLTDNPEPTTFSKDEIDKYFGGVRTSFRLHALYADRILLFHLQSNYLGSNSRARGDRSRQIGWRPKYEAEDFFRSLDEEVKVTLSKANADGTFDFGGKL